MENTHTRLPIGREVIYQKGNLIITVSSIAETSVVSLLTRTIYGTNGVRYQHTGQDQKVGQLHKPSYFQLMKNEDLLGTYCLDERQVQVGNSSIRAFYGRFLSIDEAHKGQGYGRLLKTEAVRYIEQNTPPPFVFYSYIEEKNSRSLTISKSEGFRSVSILKTFIFRRYSPRRDERFCQLKPARLPEIIRLLEKAYTNYTFKTFAHIGFQQNYFVLLEGDEIIAGVQANPVCWRFQDMPGVGGWVMMHLLPYLSTTRRFFNPTSYAFVALEGLYLKKGAENNLYPLLESVLAHFGLHSALWQIDSNDPRIALLSNSKSGILSGFQKDIRTHVLIKAVGIDEAQLALHYPQYASCFDFT